MPQELYNTDRNQITPMVVDLCCGMGGISLAAKQMKMHVVVGVDIEPAATRTFKHNFPEAKSLLGSVRSRAVIQECINLVHETRKSRQRSIVVSGPPCQGFSIAGPRDPNDPRNQILQAVGRCIVEIQPDCALIENVARILDNSHSSRVKNLFRLLSNSGYYVNEVLLDAADYGVPQRRKRAFFMITKTYVSRENILAFFEERKKPKISVHEVLNDLPIPMPRPDRYVDIDDCGTLTNHFAMQHSAKVIEKIASIKQGTGPMSYRKLHPDRTSNTLISGHRAPPAHYSEPRSITVREAMRLQGFPDDFRVFGPYGNQMGQVTNAVPPPLAKVALEVLCKIAGVEIND